MLSLLKASMEYVAVASLAGANEGSLYDSSVASLMKKFGEVRSVPLVEATNMLELVASSVLPKAKQSILAECINAKVLLAGESSTAKKMQSHNHVEAYLTGVEWDQLKNTDVYSDTDCLHMLAGRMLRIGLLHPSEPTSKNIVSLLTAARANAGTGVTGLELIREFKAIHKSLAPGYHECAQGPTTYPSTTETFKALQPAIFAEAYKGEAAPVPSKIPRVQILRVQYAQPCRSTKASCKGVPPQKAAASNSTLQMQHMVAGAMHAFANLQEKQQPRAILDRNQSLAVDNTASSGVRLSNTASSLCGVEVPEPPSTGTGQERAMQLATPQKAKSPWPPIPLSWSAEPPAAPVPLPAVPEPPAAPVPLPAAQLPLPAVPVPAKVAVKNHMELMEAMKKHLQKSDASAPAAAAKALLKRPAAAMGGSAPSSAGEGFASPAAKLAKGWRVEQRVRHSGYNKGQAYMLYYSPKGKQYRSLREIENAT
jgi:hypothetical protein